MSTIKHVRKKHRKALDFIGTKYMLTIAEILRFHTVCHVITYSSNSAESSNHPPQEDKVRRNPIRRMHGTSLQPEQIDFL